MLRWRAQLLEETVTLASERDGRVNENWASAGMSVSGEGMTVIFGGNPMIVSFRDGVYGSVESPPGPWHNGALQHFRDGRFVRSDAFSVFRLDQFVVVLRWCGFGPAEGGRVVFCLQADPRRCIDWPGFRRVLPTGESG